MIGQISPSWVSQIEASLKLNFTGNRSSSKEKITKAWNDNLMASPHFPLLPVSIGRLCRTEPRECAGRAHCGGEGGGGQTTGPGGGVWSREEWSVEWPPAPAPALTGTGLDWTALNNNQLQPLAPGLPLRLQGLLASQSQYCNSQTRTMYGHHSNV